MYLDIFAYYGPLWFLLLGIIFFVIQFFAERKYPIGVLNPPTITYFMSFNILIIAFFLYINYDYYIEFFSPAIKANFIEILSIQLVLVITGVIFIFFKKANKKWIQAAFLLLLVFNIFYSYDTALTSEHAGREMAVSKGNTQNILARKASPRKIKIVIMDGLSLDLIDALSSEQKLLNFNEVIKKGVSGKITGYKPNLALSFLNTALTGLKPSEFTQHSNTKFKFLNVKPEFDVRPRYIFFRKSSYLGVTSFYNKYDNDVLDHIKQQYERCNLQVVELIRPDVIPVYSEKSLRINNRFIPFFSETLTQEDEKYRILKKAFFFDDYLMKCMRQHWEDPNIYYSVVYFPGVEIVSQYFYQYHDPQIGGNLSETDIKKYAWVIEQYYEYYASIIGNLISTTGENELLVILSFFEYEPLPVWRRILVNWFDQKDIYVYKSLNSQGSIILYEKNALKKDYPLKTISIYDIYPTILYYSGFQFSNDMKGELIREIFTDEFVLNNPIDVDTRYNRLLSRQ
ncbi:MAG TPA: hypothetical protein VK186_28610 [Candidatus Deferrimicrobium sp.]|nr:hypothetical protein [Candidatus Deferrimicrobium sp.]